MKNCFFCRINSFISQNSLLSDSQYGFRSGRSTCDAIVELLHYAHKSLNNSEYFGFVSLDLSKALEDLFRRPIYNVLKSYLKDRTQFVSCDGLNSHTLNIETGVPQGSVLGPVLFNLYVNDLPNVVKNNGVRALMYADDTTVFSSNSDIYKLCLSLKNNLCFIEKWLRSNFLTLNLQKTSCMFITMKRIPNDAAITINNASVTLVDNIDFLGVCIDAKLTFKNHILNVSNKLSKNTGIMYRLNYLPESILKTLYFSLIYPYIIYCIVIWGSACISNLNSLIVLQKKAIRIISHCPMREHTDPLFKNLSILKFEQLYKMYTSIYMYKVFKCSIASFIKNEIECHQVHRSTDLRNSRKFRLPKVNKNLKYKNSVLYSGTVLWNNVPDKSKDRKTVQSFKKDLFYSYIQ